MQVKHLFTMLCLSASVLSAQESRPVAFLFGVGITAGGDKLADVQMSDGSTRSISAGGTFYGKVGLDWRLNPKVSLQGTFGIHEGDVTANNGTLKFQRNFVEGLAYWHTTRRQRLGVGLRKTSGASVTSSGAAASIGSIDFSSTLGYVVEYEWSSRSGPRGFGLSLRYVDEQYSPTALNGIPVQGPSVDGSHVGAGFTFYF